MDINSKQKSSKIKELYAVRKQFFRFCLVGVSNTGISLGIYYLFIIFSEDLYLLGNTVGFFVSVLNAYYWSNRFVFQKTEKGHIKPLLKTYLAYGITFLCSTGLLYVLVQYVHVEEAIAPLITLMVTIPLNFLLNKYWSFN